MGCEPSGASLESLVDERARANGLLGHGADRALLAQPNEQSMITLPKARSSVLM